MKAVVLHEYGGPEKLKFEDNVPEPQISGSTVLIAAAAASVNPIDWKLRSGMRQKDSPLSFPAILGLRLGSNPPGRKTRDPLQMAAFGLLSYGKERSKAMAVVSKHRHWVASTFP